MFILYSGMTRGVWYSGVKKKELQDSLTLEAKFLTPDFPKAKQFGKSSPENTKKKLGMCVAIDDEMTVDDPAVQQERKTEQQKETKVKALLRSWLTLQNGLLNPMVALTYFWELQHDRESDVCCGRSIVVVFCSTVSICVGSVWNVERRIVFCPAVCYL